MTDDINHQDPTGGVSRRGFLAGTGSTLALAGLAGTLAAPAIAQAKAVRVGLGLNYGPFNQPWRRGCYTLLKKVVELGGEPVTVRGTPSKQSEQDSARTLLDRDIDVLVLGIYSLESETAYLVEEAQRRGIKTVGFAVPVKDSPFVTEDTYGTGTVMGYHVMNATGRQGTFVQTAESRGFYTPFDQEGDTFALMASYEPRMKLLEFMSGSVSTQDQISKGRENVLSLLQANPQPGSITGIISWWWPLTIGAAQALRQMNRTDVRIFNHYFSNQLLEEMSQPDSPIEFSTDVPWHTMGEMVAETAIKLGQGEEVPPFHSRVPVTQITKDQAAEALAEVQKMDEEAIAFLAQYGG
ncbi:sugar ABC transporter substrate-binding protein [Ruixingdingia sedimenti]|uniref:Substrate-binding domain-containing protein n=1 Tax=Ruixingdingia sedimenti TaxID=3073604 RepID=A0ABU1F426_9RHOB|nr:substrate-binding domain-containing protein [Xinfangfangia sp. LG-4]MDR5651618.1 substrate-binding domain-containing protein [Xinfangfangia sp. LG-4]